MATEIRKLLFNKDIKASQSDINLCIQIISKHFAVKPDDVIDIIIEQSTQKFSPRSLQLTNLPSDILTTIMMNTDRRDISKMCLSTKETVKICSDEYFWAQKFKKDFWYMKINELNEEETWKGLHGRMIKSITKTEKMIDQIEKGEDNNPVDKWSLIMKNMNAGLKTPKPYFVLSGLYDHDGNNLVNDELIHTLLPKNIATKLRKELNDEDRSEGAADLYSIMFKYQGKFKKYEAAPFVVLLNVSDFFGIGASQHVTRKNMETLLEKINFYYPNASLNYFNPAEG